MAAPSGSARSFKIRFSYQARSYFVENDDLITPPLKEAAPFSALPPGTSATASASASSASVVFIVQYILRLSVRENPMTEFLEEKGWLETRQSSSLELPWSTDEGRLIIDDDNNLQLSEALTVVRVPKPAHQLIIDKLCLETAAVSHLAGLAPKIVVHISLVTHIRLPLMDEEGKAICPGVRDYTHVDPIPQTEEEEEIDLAKFIDTVKKYIVGLVDINEKEEDASIQGWFLKLTQAIDRVAWPVAEEEEEAKEEVVKKEAYDEEEEAKEERICPICLETLFKPDEKRREMPCCSQVFHRDCISKWTKRVKKCPWCRSSLPLVLQSAKGLVKRQCSDMVIFPSRPGFHDQLVALWHLLRA